MKYFGITKTGYSSGLYGCSAEYFTCIFSDDRGLGSFRFYGMYGAESRVAELMNKRGYKERYVASEYGKIPYYEGTKYSKEEGFVIKNIDEILKNNI